MVGLDVVVEVVGAAGESEGVGESLWVAVRCVPTRPAVVPPQSWVQHTALCADRLRLHAAQISVLKHPLNLEWEIIMCMCICIS